MTRLRTFTRCVLANTVLRLAGRSALVLASEHSGAGHRIYSGEPTIPNRETLIDALELIGRMDPVRSQRFRIDAPRILIATTVPSQYWWSHHVAVLRADRVDPKRPLNAVFALVELSVFARIQRKFGARLGTGRTQQLQRAALRAQVSFAERLAASGVYDADRYLAFFRTKLDPA